MGKEDKKRAIQCNNKQHLTRSFAPRTLLLSLTPFPPRYARLPADCKFPPYIFLRFPPLHPIVIILHIPPRLPSPLNPRRRWYSRSNTFPPSPPLPPGVPFHLLRLHNKDNEINSNPRNRELPRSRAALHRHRGARIRCDIRLPLQYNKRLP